jgi:hypothetical protein
MATCPRCRTNSHGSEFGKTAGVVYALDLQNAIGAQRSLGWIVVEAEAAHGRSSG